MLDGCPSFAKLNQGGNVSYRSVNPYGTYTGWIYNQPLGDGIIEIHDHAVFSCFSSNGNIIRVLNYSSKPLINQSTEWGYLPEKTSSSLV